LTQRNNFDHYVTKHYLNNFRNDAGTLFIGDVNSLDVEEAEDLSRVFGDRNWSLSQDLEDYFTAIETPVADAFKRVKSDPTAVKGLATKTREQIGTFMAIHSARSPALHEAATQSYTKTEAAVKQGAPSQRAADAFSLGVPDRATTMSLGLDAARKMESVLRMKSCIGVLAPRGRSFLTSDCPVATLSSQQSFYMRGALFAPETYFWFPLNSQLGLFLGDRDGPKFPAGKLRLQEATDRACKELNKSQVWSAHAHIAGQYRGVVRLGARHQNVGQDRAEVEQIGPYVMNSNNAVFRVEASKLGNLV